MPRWWEDASTLDRIAQISRRKAQQPGGAARVAWSEVAPSYVERPAPVPQVHGPNASIMQHPETWFAPPPQQTQMPQRAWDFPLPTVMRGWDVPSPQPTGRVLPAFRDAWQNWEQIKAESVDAPWRQPSALGTWWEQARAAREARRAQGMGRIPLQAQGLGPQTQEQERVAGPEQGLIGATWQDLKQVPVVGGIPRVIESTARGTIEALDASARAVENVAGLVSAQNRYAQYPGANVTAAQVPTLEEQLTSEGYDQERARAAVLEATRISYSGRDAMLRAARRVLAGEDPRAVADGREVDLQNPTAEDIAAYQRYIRGVRARGEDVDAAIQQIQETARIPGEAKVVPEMIGQVVLDPVNIMQAGLNVLDRAPDAQAVRRAGQALGVVEEGVQAAAKVGDEVVDVARLAAETPALQDATRLAVEAAAPEKARGWLARVWDRVNPLQLTPESQARQAVNQAVEISGTLIADVDNADDAVRVMRQFVDDPQAMEAALGTLPEWASSKRARSALQTIADQVEKFDSVKAARAGAGFNPAEFILDMDEALLKSLVPDAPKALTPYRTLAENYKGIMSEFYLRTPGYAVRNAIGDIGTMAHDGLLSLDSFDTVSDFYSRFGPTTSRVEQGLRGGIGVAQEAQIGRSRLGRLIESVLGEGAGKTVGRLSEKMGEFISTGKVLERRTMLGEETRYVKAHHKALSRALAQVWRPQVPAELAEQLGPTRTRALQGALARAVNRDEMLAAVTRATGGDALGLFDYGRFLGDQADDLSVELIRSLDDSLRGVTSQDDIARVFDDLSRQLDGDLGRAVAGDPLPPVRRMNTTLATAQDVAEDAADMERLAQAAGVDGERARAMAQQYVADVTAMEAETAQIEAQVMEQAGALLESGDGDPRAVIGAMRDVRSRTWDLQMETRAQVDDLRKTLRKEINQVRDAANLGDEARRARISMLWDQYYQDVHLLRGDEQVRVRQMLGEMQQTLAQGKVPPVEDAGQRVQQLRARMEQLRGRRERLESLGIVENLAADDPDFAQKLERYRVAVDSSQVEAWRMALVNPSRDALDVVAQAERDVQAIGAAAAARQEEAFQLWRSTWGRKGAMTKAEYRDVVDAIWNQAFREQAGRFDMARREMFGLPLGERAQAALLGELGWPQDAVQGLSRETASLVLRERIPWDVTTGGPTLPLEQLEEWTLEGLARMMGIDVTDPRMVDGADWARIAKRAEREARIYENLGVDANAYFATAGPAGRRAGLNVVDALRNARAGDPAFAQRMERGAVLLREIADGAAARAGLSSLNVGIDVIPEGATQVERVRRGNTWLVQLRGDGQTLAEVGFDNPAEALREVRRLEVELAQGAGIPNDWVPRNLMEAAQRFGVDEGSADDWARLADVAEARGTDWLMLGDEYGRQSTAAQEALRLPESTPRTIYQTEVTARAGRMSAREELARVRELGRESRGAAEAYVGQVLEMAGVTNAELRELKLEQRVKLLEEIAAGNVIERPSGGARQIDGLTPQRRARIIETAVSDADLVRLAQGAATDPRAALGYEWMDIAEQARARSEAARLLDGGMIDAGGLADALADDEGRRALLATMEEMAAERGDEAQRFSDSVNRIFEETDDELEEAVRRLIAGGMSHDEVGRLYADALADDGARARLLERALSDGGMLHEEVIRYSQAAGQVVEPPTMGEMADVVVRQQQRLLSQIRDGMLGEWDGLRGEAEKGVAPWVRNRARRWVQGDLQKQWTQARAVAVRAATQMADDALLDYSKRRRFDTWLGLITPYSYWRTRSARNWAKRFIQRPTTLVHYLKYKRAMQQFNEKRGYRQRFEGAVEIPTGGVLPEWMGGAVFVDPSSMLWPFEGLEANTWDDPSDAKNGVDWLYKTLSRYGFRPHGFIGAALEGLGLVQEEAAPGERRNLLQMVADVPQARVVRGALALARRSGQGPVAPQMRPWESYRVARMLSDMAGDDPQLTADVLLGQEIMRRVATGELSPGEAIGREMSPNLERMAQVNGWTDEDVTIGQQILAEAWRRVQQESGIGALTSGIAGVNARIYPSGERAQVDLQGQLYGQTYSPLTGQGSRAAYQALRNENPQSYARGVARSFVPGEVEVQPDADWTPQTARGVLQYREEKALALDALNVEQLAALRSTGLWDSTAARSARNAYSQSMQETRAQLGLGDYESPEVWQARYGSTPEEAVQQAQDVVLQAISDARPRKADFDGSEAYDEALKSFLRKIQAGNLTDAGVELPQGLPGSALEYAKTVDEDAIAGLWRENDTLAEAVQAAFLDWYGDRWDAYREAVGERPPEGASDATMDAYYRRRKTAWALYIENDRPVSNREMLQRMRLLYGDRFKRDDVLRTLTAVGAPTMMEAWEGRMSPEELAARQDDQAKSAARDQFWEAFKALPEDATWKETKGQPIVAVVLDKGSRGTVTREQYEMAAAVLRGWLEENGYSLTSRRQTVDGRQGGTRGGDSQSARTNRSGYTRRSYGGGGGYTRRSYGGGGRSYAGGGGAWGLPSAGDSGLPRALADWGSVRRVVAGPLRRQLESFFLRGTALDSGGRRELELLAKSLGWGGTLDALLELLAGVFKARVTRVGGPSGQWRPRRIGRY